MHGGEGAGPGPGAGETGGGHGVDAASRDEHHILAAELLLEFAHQPLLDLVELLQLAERDVDHDRGAATGHVNLLRAVDVEVLELSLELVVGSLEVEESLKR